MADVIDQANDHAEFLLARAMERRPARAQNTARTAAKTSRRPAARPAPAVSPASTARACAKRAGGGDMGGRTDAFRFRGAAQAFMNYGELVVDNFAAIVSANMADQQARRAA